jgi:hypothetical protein
MKLRRIALLAAVALIGTLFTAAPATAVPCGNIETVALKTFYIEAKAAKKVYKVGQTAVINVNITRPSDQDPAGMGIPMERPVTEPAQDVNVGIGVRVGDVFLFGYGLTDAKGNAAVKVKIESWTPAGTAIADIFAWLIQADTPCLRIEENGYRQNPRAFKVVKR